MLLIWIIYVILLIAGLSFFVLYKDLLSLILFCVIIAVPLVIGLMHFIAYLCTKIEVETPDTVVTKANPAKVKISVKNSSPFSITGIRINAKCKNLFLNIEHDCMFVVTAKPFTNKEFTYTLLSDHIGNIKVEMKKAKMYDLFSLFRFNKKLNVNTVISVLPESVPVTASLRANNYFYGEADTYSTAKAGDDPSEVFNIRDYVDGDKLNKIHWKLTGKMDHYMVKDYSLPVSDAVLMYVDLAVKDFEDESLVLMDSLVKSLLSISQSFVEKSINHYIAWYDYNRKCFHHYDVKTPQDIFTVIGRMFSNGVSVDETLMEKCDLFEKNRYSHILMFTANNDNSPEKQFAGFDLRISLFSVVKVAFEKETKIPTTYAETEIIPVIPDKESSCLYDVKF